MCSETQFSLRWNNFGATMTSALNTLQQLGDFVDVTLAAEGMQLKAHKVVLSACSPYFREILKSNPCQHPVIILREVNIDDLESVLTFMYEGEVNVTQPRLHTFMRLAEALQVKGLTESSSSSYPSLNQNSKNPEQRNMETTESNSSSLDLTNKVNRNSSPRIEPPPQSCNSSMARNNYQNDDIRRSQLRADDSKDSPPVSQASKRRKLSTHAESASPLSQHNIHHVPQPRLNSQNLLEVKLEPDEFPEESKENGNLIAEKAPAPQPPRESPTPDAAKSPLPAADLSQTFGARHSPKFPPQQQQQQQQSAPEKRATVAVPRAEKQPVNYQPEFPQDPSCHHSLPYPCPFCEKSYTSWGFRRRHIKGYHTSTPELPCKWCSAVLPSHQDWESHVTRTHRLTLTDARNGILILEEAHMVLQIAQPTRIDSLMELIKNKKMKDDKEGEEGGKEERKEGEGGKERREGEREKGKNLRSNRGGEASR